MRQGFTPEFISKMAAESRQPIILMTCFVNSNEYLISDRRVVFGDAEVEFVYEPWVESWGSLTDNSRPDGLTSGGALEARSCQLSIYT